MNDIVSSFLKVGAVVVVGWLLFCMPYVLAILKDECRKRGIDL